MLLYAAGLGGCTIDGGAQAEARASDVEAQTADDKETRRERRPTNREQFGDLIVR
ncbi:MAG: hypothetical protein AAFX76_11790 [Planctomycetota bacterium]